jgi:hypothetical protein
MQLYIKNKLERVIDELFYDLHQEYDTKSGDISPMLQHELDETIEKLSHLITRQVKDNLYDIPVIFFC